MTPLDDAVTHARKTSISFDEFLLRVRQPGYRYLNTEWYKAGKALEAAAKTPPPPPPPPPPAPSGFGDAGIFAGRGIMLGGNRDVWDQAIVLAREGFVDVIAVIPGTLKAYFRSNGVPATCSIVTWVPPELEPSEGDIHQAENQTEWMRAINHNPDAVCLNSWQYGRLDGKVAIVEAYYNEGWGLNFEEFRNYMSQGAKGVVPLCGGYSAAGRSDAESARIYQSLATWSGGSFPGFWMYAGESYLTKESVEVLKAWRVPVRRAA